MPKMAATTPNTPVAPGITRGTAAPELVDEPLEPLLEAPLTVFGLSTLPLQRNLPRMSSFGPAIPWKWLHASETSSVDWRLKAPLTRLMDGNSSLPESVLKGRLWIEQYLRIDIATAIYISHDRSEAREAINILVVRVVGNEKTTSQHLQLRHRYVSQSRVADEA